MTERDKKMIRNRTAGFLIFTGQQITRHTAIRKFNGALVPVMLKLLFLGAVH